MRLAATRSSSREGDGGLTLLGMRVSPSDSCPWLRRGMPCRQIPEGFNVSRMTARRHAEIAGAGFAGLTAAIALTARGWSVRVHEASPELRALGAGIFIWENGLRV